MVLLSGVDSWRGGCPRPSIALSMAEPMLRWAAGERQLGLRPGADEGVRPCTSKASANSQFSSGVNPVVVPARVLSFTKISHGLHRPEIRDGYDSSCTAPF